MIQILPLCVDCGSTTIVIIPPRNYTTDFAYFNLRVFLYISCTPSDVVRQYSIQKCFYLYSLAPLKYEAFENKN